MLWSVNSFHRLTNDSKANLNEIKQPPLCNTHMSCSCLPRNLIDTVDGCRNTVNSCYFHKEIELTVTLLSYIISDKDHI